MLNFLSKGSGCLYPLEDNWLSCFFVSINLSGLWESSIVCFYLISWALILFNCKIPGSLNEMDSICFTCCRNQWKWLDCRRKLFKFQLVIITLVLLQVWFKAYYIFFRFHFIWIQFIFRTFIFLYWASFDKNLCCLF